MNEFKTIRVAKATYDFDVHTGAVASAVGLGVVIPKGAIVTRVIGSAVTALNSNGEATVAINIGSTEVKAVADFDDEDYIDVDSHYSTAVKLTADSEVNLDIAVADLTAGVYDIYVEYLY